MVTDRRVLNPGQRASCDSRLWRDHGYSIRGVQYSERRKPHVLAPRRWQKTQAAQRRPLTPEISQPGYAVHPET